MTSPQARLARRLIRWQMSGWMDGPVPGKRAKIERLNRLAPLPAGVRCATATADGVPVEWIDPAVAGGGVLLYFHGGAYAMGSLDSHRELAARLAVAGGLRALAVGYRLAPEDPYPAALHDALIAYRWLRGQGTAAAHIVIAGDSAGGGLALAALLALRAAGEALPGAAVLFSPWTDLALTGASVQDKAAVDPILTPAGLARFAALYAGAHALDEPLISPHYAGLRGLPPLLIQVGTDEILLDDARRLAANARAAGVPVTLRTWAGLFHVFQTVSFLPETQEALAQFAAFVAARP